MSSYICKIECLGMEWFTGGADGRFWPFPDQPLLVSLIADFTFSAQLRCLAD